MSYQDYLKNTKKISVYLFSPSFFNKQIMHIQARSDLLSLIKAGTLTEACN